MFKFDLGDKVKDIITPLTGIVVGRTEWLNGCIRYSVQPQKLIAGKLPEYEQMDEAQLILVKAKATPVKQGNTGGPRPAAKRMSGVRRF